MSADRCHGATTATLITMPAVLFVVYALAVARVTKLINNDRLLKAPRDKLIKRLPEGSIWAYFVFCAWCASVWVSAVAAPLTWWFGGLETPGVSAWLAVPALTLAYSAVAGYLAKLAED